MTEEAMKLFFRTSKKALIGIAFMLLLMNSSAEAADGDGSVAGKTFKAFIYSPQADKVSISITFEENQTLLIDEYDGFGVYVPAGPAFAGFFSAPRYKNEDNLFLILSGILVTDFLSGVGVSLVNFEYAGAFVVFGYTET
jgi:hypothetical protein